MIRAYRIVQTTAFFFFLLLLLDTELDYTSLEVASYIFMTVFLTQFNYRMTGYGHFFAGYSEPFCLFRRLCLMTTILPWVQKLLEWPAVFY